MKIRLSILAYEINITPTELCGEITLYLRFLYEDPVIDTLEEEEIKKYIIKKLRHPERLKQCRLEDKELFISYTEL